MKKIFLSCGVFITTVCLVSSCSKEQTNNAKTTISSLSVNKELTGKPISDSGLICYLPFNGNLHDKSGNGNHGTLKGGGAISYVTDKHGNANHAISFGTSASWIEIPEAQIDGLSSLTIAMDIYPTSLTGPQNIFSKMSYNARIGSSEFYQSYGLGFQNGIPAYNLRAAGFCNASSGGWEPTVFSNTSLIVNTWNHIAVTFDSSREKMFLNGVLVGVSTVTPTSICTGEPMRLGIWWHNDPQYFTGNMDEVRIYGRALTVLEIRNLAKK